VIYFYSDEQDFKGYHIDIFLKSRKGWITWKYKKKILNRLLSKSVYLASIPLKPIRKRWQML